MRGGGVSGSWEETRAACSTARTMGDVTPEKIIRAGRGITKSPTLIALPFFGSQEHAIIDFLLPCFCAPIPQSGIGSSEGCDLALCRWTGHIPPAQQSRAAFSAAASGMA